MPEGQHAKLNYEDIVLDRIRIVLVEPSHPGNIGGAARAMKTMGMQRLVLVIPHSPRSRPWHLVETSCSSSCSTS